MHIYKETQVWEVFALSLTSASRNLLCVSPSLGGSFPLVIIFSFTFKFSMPLQLTLGWAISYYSYLLLCISSVCNWILKNQGQGLPHASFLFCSYYDFLQSEITEYVFIGGDFGATGHAFRLEVRLHELPCAEKPAGSFRESFSRIVRDLGKALL